MWRTCGHSSSRASVRTVVLASSPGRHRAAATHEIIADGQSRRHVHGTPQHGVGHQVLIRCSDHGAGGETTLIPVPWATARYDDAVQRPRLQVPARGMGNVPRGVTLDGVGAHQVVAVIRVTVDEVPRISQIVAGVNQHARPPVRRCRWPPTLRPGKLLNKNAAKLPGPYSHPMRHDRDCHRRSRLGTLRSVATPISGTT